MRIGGTFTKLTLLLTESESEPESEKDACDVTIGYHTRMSDLSIVPINEFRLLTSRCQIFTVAPACLRMLVLGTHMPPLAQKERKGPRHLEV